MVIDVSRMLRIIWVAAIALASLCLGCHKLDPALFISAEGQFSVSFPGVPARSHTSVQTLAGEITVFLFQVSSREDRRLFEVSYYDHPAKPGRAAEGAVIDGAIEGAMRSLEARVVSVRKIIDNGQEFTEVSATVGRGFYFGRFAIRNGRVYQVYAAGDKPKPDQVAGEFVASFRLTA